MLRRAWNLARGAAATAVGGVTELLEATGAGVSSAAPGRVHVPVRGVHADADASRRAEQMIAEHHAVRRAEVNAVLGHVMVEFDPDRISAADVAELVRAAERDGGLDTMAHAGRDHPGSVVRTLREAALLGLHAAGLVYTGLGRALPAAPVALPSSVLALVDSAPRLRSAVTAAVGEPAADVLLSSATAITHALGRRPLGLLVDGCQRYALHQEARARRGAWVEWERALAEQDGAHRSAPPSPATRPIPLPPGPVEKIADRTALAALVGATGLAALGGSTAPAGAALAVGAAKAARCGREGFAARLGRDAAARGSLVMDPGALRRLDRVDTIVLDADVLQAGALGVNEVAPLAEVSDAELSELVERTHDLVDLRRPTRKRAREGWMIEPLTSAAGEPTLVAARRLARRADTVLVLHRGTEPVAVVGVAPILDPFAEAIVAAAGEAGLVVLAGPPELGRRLETDASVPGGDELVRSVRGLQADGHVVALVSRRDLALAAADVGIGFTTVGQAPAWHADVLTRTAGEVCLLLAAVGPAGRVSIGSSRLAVAGSGLGALLALLGPPQGAAGRGSVAVQTAALLALGLGTWSGTSIGRRPEPVPADRTPWHAMSTAAVLDSLRTSRDGLAEPEARRRLREQPGEPADQPDPGLVRTSAEELATPITPALAAAAGISAASGSLIDPVLISVVLLVNALIGGAQRVSAQKSVRMLRRDTASWVRVRRGGTEARRRAGQLVEGDVIRLQAGDAIPADCRVLSAHDLEVDESTLTGESAPVAKSVRSTSAVALADRHSMLYEGTVVAAGRCEAVVVATGNRTEAGRAQQGQGESAPVTGVEARLRSLTARILPISAGAGVALFAVDLLRRRPLGSALTRGVTLAVAAVPEGLPVVATVAELAAAKRLAGRGALVRNPSTIEALGRVDVLCFDKTGTLTEGRISLRTVSDGTDSRTVDQPLPRALQDVVAAAVRASPFRADPGQVTHQTDRAVLGGAAALGIAAENGHAFVEPIDELPFESSRGYHATLWRGRSGARISVKGAPEVVLPLCSTRRRDDRFEPFTDAARAEIDAEVHRLARRGHRVLAVAQRRVDATDLADADLTGLEFRGLVALVDPVRPTAAAAVATLRASGVQIAMITGDHPSTAESIATELDALNGREVLTGAEIEQLTDDELSDALPRVAVFARVTPAQKSRIVRLLRRRGLAVAVTGDGTNDAPAIRLADVGIALGARATPAAREAADVVITDDRIETITDAIVEGRGMWASVRDALSILLGGNLGEIAYTLGTGLIGGKAVLNARQLLLVNLLTDVLPAMAVAVRPPPGATAETLLAEGPERSLGSALTTDIQVRAAITAAAAAAAWLLARPVSSPGQASTAGLVALVGAQLGQTLAVRGRTPLVAAAALGSLALLAVAVQVPGLSHAVGSRPLLPHQWGIALTAAAAASAAQLLAQRLTPA